jgi:Ca-activated chloride channel family protein
MRAILDREVGLLKATAATGAFIEIVPAPGVQILGTDGAASISIADGGVRVPLGTMFGGQHREMVLRARVNAVAGEGGRALASVRLHFRDPSDSGLERVQEVVARYQVTSDAARVTASVNHTTRAIMATQQAAQITVAAAQQMNDGHLEAADKQLAVAEVRLHEAAAHARNDADRQRMMATATRITRSRAAAKATAASPSPAPPAAARARALDLNEAAMRASGL